LTAAQPAAGLLPVAVAAGVLPVTMGAPVTGVVLGSMSMAVIIGVMTPAGPRVVSLLNREATGVANGVRIPQRTRFDRIQSGDSARIGAGNIKVGSLELRVVRTWSSRVRQVRPRAAFLAQLTAALAGIHCGVEQADIERLRTALAADQGLPAGIDALVGLGQGLTPAGDDVIAGLLTALHAIGRGSFARRIGEQALQNETTTLSADLLRLAGDGHACLEMLGLLAALHRPDAPVAAAIDRLLSIGHTSGADLATGLAMGLQMREGR
jgi:hypothetical protein